MELLYKTSNIEISCDYETGTLYCNWIGRQTETSLREAGKMMHDLFVEKHCTKILNDNSNVVGPWNHSTDWAANQWFPVILKAGLRKFAWVFPTDKEAQLSAYQVTPKIEEVKTFLSREQAWKWLTQA